MEPIPINGKHPPIDPQTRALTHALEDLHIAAKALSLPPMRVEWQEANPDLSEFEDAEKRALQAHISTFLADYEGVRTGPIALPISEIPEPANPDTFLVGNLIRPGTTFMLAGPPGAAKSWASRQLGLAASAGVPWFLDRYPIPRPLNVLVVDEDNGPDEEWRREQTVMAHLELERPAMGAYRRISLEGVQLDQERWQRWLRGQIRLHDIDLTILDPISEMHGGKELREDPAFRSMLAFLKRLKVDFPRHATAIVHHTRKRDPKAAAGSATLEDVRGQWGQTPDVVAMLVQMGDRRSKWEVHKRVPHSALILEQIAEGQPGEGSLRFAADPAEQKSRAMQNDGVVIDAIRGGLSTFTEIQAGIGMPKGTLNGVLKRLVGAGLLRKQGHVYELVGDDE